MEQLCLKSFVDQGQRITLFSYEDIPNVPEGVLRRDGREVFDTNDFIKYEKKDSFALFADLFRVLMLKACPGLIWVDTDVYCHAPMTYDSDYVMGYELPGSLRVNNAVLGLPADSAVLDDMIRFMSDRYAIPSFVKPALQAEYRAAAAAGAPVHVSQQPWGVWGPLMLTHFCQKHRLRDLVQPLAAFYPVPFPDRLKFLRRTAVVTSLLDPKTTALHLWASNKRELGLRHHGVPPEGSYLDDLLKKHQINAHKAPITARGRRQFDAGLAALVTLDHVDRFADIGGTALSTALAAHARWGCAIDLIYVDHKGRWQAQPSPWVAPYRAQLEAGGVPPDKIRHVGAEDEMRSASLIANLANFGDVNRLKPLDGVLAGLTSPGAQILSDIRHGSGAFPYFRAHGDITKLSVRSDDGTEVTRVLVTLPGQPPQERDRPDAKGKTPLAGPPRPKLKIALPPKSPALTGQMPVTSMDQIAPAEGPEPWSVIAARLAGHGGWTRETEDHSFLYIPRSSDTLVVTFDNLDIAMTKREDRRPWGFSFIEKQGWSMLGVMAHGWTWYRDDWVCQQFDDLAASGFFAPFKRVVFYGASMGGYAACAFVAACPGADVVAISPQSTLDKRLVPFETRYSKAWGRDFTGKYGDASQVSATAGRVTLLYDPYEPLDAGHVNRFTGQNVLKLRAPLMGHRLGSSLQQMGILSDITIGALNGTLTEIGFYRTLRARKTFSRYQKELFKRAVKTGHPQLARLMGRYVLTRGDNRYIRKELAAL